MADEKQFWIEQRQTNAKHEQAIQRLDVTVGQLAKEISIKKQGEFPAQTIPNPRVTNNYNLSRFSEAAR